MAFLFLLRLNSILLCTLDHTCVSIRPSVGVWAASAFGWLRVRPSGTRVCKCCLVFCSKQNVSGGKAAPRAADEGGRTSVQQPRYLGLE